jgi:hypothetical protein
MIPSGSKLLLMDTNCGHILECTSKEKSFRSILNPSKKLFVNIIRLKKLLLPTKKNFMDLTNRNPNSATSNSAPTPQ